MNLLSKTLYFICCPLLVFGLQACEEKEQISQYAPTEIYPEDTILSAIVIKRAMIVVAHDDDMCAMTGTISTLKKKGWEVKIASIDKGDSRNAAHRKACRHLSDTVTFFGLKPEQLRRDLENGNPSYYAFPKKDFEKVFIRENVEPLVLQEINSFQPSIIFTLDHEFGGYGHPEHVFMSQLVLELAQSSRIKPLYIYQSVFTDHMETSIMARHKKRMISWGFPGDEWDKAKEAYQLPKGMPEPSVQVYISNEAEAKMMFLKSYNERERKTLGFFIPAFEAYSAEEYFKVFDREFFRIIPLNHSTTTLN